MSNGNPHLPTSQPLWRVDRHGPAQEVLDFTTGTIPTPAPGQFLVGVQAAGVNLADGLQCEGTYQHPATPPFTPGLELAGVALAGDLPSGVSVGDPVVGTAATPHGAWAHYALANTDEAFPITDTSIDPVAAAATHIVFQTAWVALHHRARMKADETVVVQGAGGATGSAAVQVATAAGARVVAVAGGAAKGDVARRCGAEVVLDHRRDDVAEVVRDLTGGRGADIAYDPVGAATLAASRRCLGFGGRLVVVGFASGGDPPQLAANHLLVRNLDVIGVAWPAYRSHRPDVVVRAQRSIEAGLVDGTLWPVLAGVRPLAQAAAALADLQAGTTVGKWVLTP